MAYLSFLSIPIGYILGSIPSSYIIGHLWAKTDIRSEGDGRISAAAVYRNVGRLPYVLVVLIDIGKGALSIGIANMLTDSLTVVLITGLVAMLGHCWSVFMKFKGGLGATVMCGVLLATVLWQLLIGLAVGAIVMATTRKSGFSSAVVIIVTTICLLLQYLLLNNVYPLAPALIIYPTALILIMILKRLQTKRISEALPQAPIDMD